MDKLTQEHIKELVEQGYEFEEVVSYRIRDPNGDTIAEGKDEDEIWGLVIRMVERDKLGIEKAKLARWNAAVRGNHE